MRASAGLSVAVSDKLELALDLLAPTLWVVRDQTVFSLDLAFEGSYEL